jgi:protein-tyrosine-phosphatase
MSARFRVFFACVGNSGRSQMAEGFCRALAADGVECKSGGSRPSGRLQPEAVQAMAERGIDISKGTSKAIDEAFAAACDLIVVMGCGDDACPAFIGKPIEDWELEDPKGAPIGHVRKVRDDIERRVRRLLASRGLLRPGA